jgi:3-hydroxyisobutyrate dehydrogenase-like beta-hydroxyacid dehydrogenase
MCKIKIHRLKPVLLKALENSKGEKPMANLSVACIGLGRMGAGIAANIQKHGFPLTVSNRTFDKTKPFVAAGAIAVRTPREAAAAAEIVITNLMDDASVLEAVTGENGILAGMRPNAIHIGTTTISPNLSTRLAALHAAHGSHYIAGPLPAAQTLRRLENFLRFWRVHPKRLNAAVR